MPQTPHLPTPRKLHNSWIPLGKLFWIRAWRGFPFLWQALTWIGFQFRYDTVHFPVFLGFNGCLGWPASCDDVICFAFWSEVHQIEGDGWELTGPSSLFEDHLVVIRDVPKIAQIFKKSKSTRCDQIKNIQFHEIARDVPTIKLFFLFNMSKCAKFYSSCLGNKN